MLADPGVRTLVAYALIAFLVFGAVTMIVIIRRKRAARRRRFRMR